MNYCAKLGYSYYLICKKKEKTFPDNIIDHKTLTNNFLTYFEEKTSKINDSFPTSVPSCE